MKNVNLSSMFGEDHPIYTWCVGHKEPLDLRPNIKINLFNHRVNLYNSKSMVIIPHIPVYNVIWCNLIFTVFYMHTFINSSFSLSCYSSIIFTKIEFILIYSIFHVSCKHVSFVHKINMLCEKVITSIRASFTHLCRMVPPQNPLEAP
jgi:hypothetical protein